MQHNIFNTRLVTNFWHKAVQMFREDSTRILESVFAGVLVLWGSYLLSPVSHRYNDVYYTAYRQVGPEFAWGGVMLLIGNVLFIAAVCDNYRARRGALLCSVCVWMALWWVYCATGRSSVGLVIIPFYALVSALLFWGLRARKPYSEVTNVGKSSRDSNVGSSNSDSIRIGNEGDRYMVGTSQQT